MAIVDNIMAYECGEMDDNTTIDFFAELVKTGMAWSLQGHYGRVASALIENGYIDKQGNVLKHVGDDDE